MTHMLVPREIELLTHNMLMSPGTRNGYPLAIEVESMEEVETDFNPDFIVRMVEKLDYAALLQTVASVSCGRGRDGSLSHSCLT